MAPGFKAGGRIAGTPNKATVLKFAGVKSVMEICRAENGKTPPEVLAETMRLAYGLAASYQEANAELIKAGSQPHVDRLHELLKRACDPAFMLMEFIYPKHKRVEYIGDAPGMVSESIEPGSPANDDDGRRAPRRRVISFQLRMDGARPRSMRGTNGSGPSAPDWREGDPDPRDVDDADVVG